MSQDITLHQESEEMVKQIRAELVDLMKKADEFVIYIEKKIQDRETELDEKIRKYQILKQREKNLDEAEQSLKKREVLVNKEKQNLRDKQLALDTQEKELNKLRDRVKNILQ